MIAGWTRDGATRQDRYHSCRHWAYADPVLVYGRCPDCRAKPWEGFVQARQAGHGLGAIPIGSPYLVTPKLTDSMLTAVPDHPGTFMPKGKFEKEIA